MKYRVSHVSSYSYSLPVSLSYNEACLSMREGPGQRLISGQWFMNPQADFQREHEDFFGNHWRFFSYERPLGSLDISCVHELSLQVLYPQGLPESPRYKEILDGRIYERDKQERDLFLCPSSFVALGEEYAAYARDCFDPELPLLEACFALTRKIYEDFTYTPNSTTIFTPLSEIASSKRGVCQDYSHFMLAVLRSLKVPSRYVSGYLYTRSENSETRGADASHAWISVLCPGRGWIDFDPTNGLLVKDEHLYTAFGRDYADISPLRGVVLGGGTQTLQVEVRVERLDP